MTPLTHHPQQVDVVELQRKVAQLEGELERVGCLVPSQHTHTHTPNVHHFYTMAYVCWDPPHHF